jgi:glycosidase
MADNDDRKARAALLALLTQRGTPVLYYGDELAMQQVDIPPNRLRDMAGRDGARTPLPWNGEWNEPWLPVGGGVPSVAAQRDDPNSFLNFCREVIARRRSHPDLIAGAYETLASPPGVWAYRRGERTAVAINLTAEPAEIDLDGRRQLAPWEGVVLDV